MKISNLSKNYNAKKVVNSVNLEIKKNKVTSFIGPNGAGKSTVMGMISRLILKDEGEIDFYDLDIAKWNSKELAKKLAILTQANNIQMKLTVYELVAFGRFPYSKGKLNELDKEKSKTQLIIWSLMILRINILMNYPADSVKEPLLRWLLPRIQNMYY